MPESDDFPDRDTAPTSAPGEPCGISAMPDPDEDADVELDESSALTLHDLHGELTASSAETRRGTRRILDVLKNFGSVLDALSATVNDTHKALRAMPAVGTRPPEGGELAREWALALVELADRIERVAHGFSQPPPSRVRWWPGARKSQAAWLDAWAMQADALGILRSHVEALLQRAGLQRLEVVGRPFDPHIMTALESTVDPSRPDHTVLAATLPGWQHAVTGQLLRPAQVRVSRSAAR